MWILHPKLHTDTSGHPITIPDVHCSFLLLENRQAQSALADCADHLNAAHPGTQHFWDHY